MRRFVVYSQTAKTSPVIKDLKAAGRIDILLHAIISALFVSNSFRDDVELHLFLMGPPNAPRHIRIFYEEKNTISKKDLKKLIEIALRKAKAGESRKVHPGVYVDDDSLEKFIEKNEFDFYFLDGTGGHLKESRVFESKYPCFILGDHDGFNKQTKKFLKKNTSRISLGPQTYFTSQAITIINYEMDNN